MIEKRRNFCYNVPVHLLFSYIKADADGILLRAVISPVSVEHTVLQKIKGSMRRLYKDKL